MIRQIVYCVLVSVGVGLVNAPIWAESPLGFFQEHETVAPISAEQIPIYDTPDGQEVGYVVLCSPPLLGGWSTTLLPGQYHQQRLVFSDTSGEDYVYHANMTSCVELVATPPSSDSVRVVAPEDVMWHLYKNDIPTLTYYATTDNFIKILAMTIEGGVWIPRHDLRSVVSPVSWCEYIVTSGQAAPCLLDGYDGLRLYDTPSEDGVVLLTLEWRRHEIVFTGHIDGNWAEADIFPRDAYGDRQGTEPLWHGWIHVVNDEGHLQIRLFATCS